MKVVVKTDKKSSIEVKEGSSINDLLRKLRINRETIIVMRNGEICVEEEELKDGDTVEILRAISGG